MGLIGLARNAIQHETVDVFAALTALILVVGSAAFGKCLLPKLRARSRSAIAVRRMARTLKKAVERENARQSLAALRNPREDAPAVTGAEYVDLLERIERIRVRGAELKDTHNAGVRGPKRSTRDATRAFAVEPQPPSAIPLCDEPAMPQSVSAA